MVKLNLLLELEIWINRNKQQFSRDDSLAAEKNKMDEFRIIYK